MEKSKRTFKQIKKQPITNKLKSKLLSKNELNLLNHLSFIILLLYLSFFISNEKELKLRNLNDDSTIKITVKGPGKIKIISSAYANKLTAVILDDNTQSVSNEVDLTDDEVHEVTMEFDELITSCSKMFNNLNGIINMDLSNFDASNSNSMESMFYNCFDLESIIFGDFDTSSVSDMSHMFEGCSKLITLDLSNFNTGSVNSMFYMFYNCKSLQHLDVSNFNTSSVSKMNQMFYGCSNLTTLNLLNFDTSSVTMINGMFSGCSELISLDLSNFSTSKIKNFEGMFRDCTKLEYINLSNFNTSFSTSLKMMFYNCESLKSLDLSGFNTEKVTDMEKLFSGCRNLLSLDLSNFDTSSCITMLDLFNNCNQLTTLDLSKFDTSGCTNMKNMFCNCYNLETIDLSSFNTQSVQTMQYMFSGCKNILSLDLSNFSRNSITNLNSVLNMLSNCESLIYLNLDSFDFSQISNLKDLLPKTSSQSKLCLDKDKANEYLIQELEENNFNVDCEDPCFTLEKPKIIPDKNKCIENCKDDEDYPYEYNNICYESCPLCTRESSTQNNLCEKIIDCEDKCDKYQYKNICFETIKEGYYLKDQENNILGKCNSKCKTCRGEATIASSNCESCFEGKILNSGNCVENVIEESDSNSEEIESSSNEETERIIEESDYSSEESESSSIKKIESSNNEETESNSIEKIENSNKEETESSSNEEIESSSNEETERSSDEETESSSIQKTGSSSVEKTSNNLESESSREEYESSRNEESTEKKEGYESIITIPKEEETDAIINCRAEDLFLSKSCGVEVSSPENKDQLITNIQNDIMDHKIDELLYNITKTKEDLVVQEKDTIYQITTTENQNNNEYKNISTVKLGDCEDRLKEIYNISKNLSLIIFKIDYYSPGLLIPIIAYEIFHPENKSKLDLNYCKDILIELNIPVSIDEDNLFKHDPNSEYYKDECVPSTSENGTDIILNDRQIEYNENNYSLCENNCTFTGYDSDTKKALCDCEIKTKIYLISEIIDNQNKLSSSNFTSNDGSSSNIVTMKCVYTLFTKEGLKSNIGSYILMLIITIFIVSSILFYKVGYPLLENDINSILLEKEKIEQNFNKIMDIYKFEQKRQKKKKFKKGKKNKKASKNTDVSFPPKKNTTKTNSSKQDLLSQTNIKLKVGKELNKLKNTKSYKKKASISINDDKNNKNIEKESIQIGIDSTKYNDFELNALSYKEALIYDKRSFTQYYLSLIKSKHILFFSFLPKKDYNIMLVKINIFFIIFATYYAINAVFINESTIHKIYEDGGSYNIIFFLPKIIYSFIISYIISIVIQNIFVSERNIFEIKNQKTLEDSKDKVDKVKKCIIIKYIIFYVLGILFLFFFWYYLSSFGAVYRNTQVILIKNTFMSFSISFVFPFVINIAPYMLRKISLKDANYNREFLFKISGYLQYI